MGATESTPPSHDLTPPLYCDYVKCLWLPESIHPSQNIPPLIFNKCICATLPESTPSSQNIPPFQQQYYMRPSQNLPLPPRIRPLFSTNSYVRPSQNLPLPPRIYPPLFQQLCATRPEYTLPPRTHTPFQKLYVTLPESTPPSQNLPPFSTNILLCDAPRIYPSLSEYTPPFQQPCATLPESTPIYPSLQEQI